MLRGVPSQAAISSAKKDLRPMIALLRLHCASNPLNLSFIIASFGLFAPPQAIPESAWE
jgi:hypothetical protein